MTPPWLCSPAGAWASRSVVLVRVDVVVPVRRDRADGRARARARGPRAAAADALRGRATRRISERSIQPPMATIEMAATTGAPRTTASGARTSWRADDQGRQHEDPDRVRHRHGQAKPGGMPDRPARCRPGRRPSASCRGRASARGRLRARRRSAATRAARSGSGPPCGRSTAIPRPVTPPGAAADDRAAAVDRGGRAGGRCGHRRPAAAGPRRRRARARRSHPARRTARRVGPPGARPRSTALSAGAWASWFVG